MNVVKRWVRNIFGFSGREVNGFVILLPLMVLIVMAQPLYRLWLANRAPDFSQDRAMLDSLIASWEVTTDSVDKTSPKTVLFRFNPNTATVTELETLGFSEILSKRIANYRQKGGQFRVKSDLMKIYGLDSSFYLQLYTYITLPEKFEQKAKEHKPIAKTDKKNVTVSFDLNTADTTQLKSVYGIGSALALRIIKFRDGLGGFIRSEQIREVYGLDSVTAAALMQRAYVKTDFVPRKINLNVANEKEFSAHPYIKRSLANAIVAYRFQHGEFTDVEDLKKIALIKEAELKRIFPYLEINN